MKRRILVGALFLAPFCPAQQQVNCNPNDAFCGLIQAKIVGEQLKMQQQRQQAEQELMKSQAAAARAQADMLRVQAEIMKQQPKTTATATASSPAIALSADPEFAKLPLALRMRFIRLVEPSLAQYSDEVLGKTFLKTASVPAPSLGDSEKLMIFGGNDHKTYLGCLGCADYKADSVFNEFGPHGNAFSVESIYNHLGEFGSLFSMYSACAPLASDPPVLVDGNGKFYGRLTLNLGNTERSRNEQLNAWLKNACE